MAKMEIKIINPIISLISRPTSTSNSCVTIFQFYMTSSPHAQMQLELRASEGNILSYDYAALDTGNGFEKLPRGTDTVETHNFTLDDTGVARVKLTIGNDDPTVPNDPTTITDSEGTPCNVTQVIVKDLTNNKTASKVFSRCNISPRCETTENPTEPDPSEPEPPNWIAAGYLNNENNNLLMSVDGTTWNYYRIPQVTDVFYLKYLKNKWYAIGTPNTATGIRQEILLESTDGLNWTKRPIPQLVGVQSITYQNNLWVVTGIGANDTIVTSTDGINWTGRGKTALDINAMGVSYGNNMWVAYGESDSYPDSAMGYSVNGTTWQNSSSEDLFPFGYDAVFNSGMWLAGGYSWNKKSLAKSTDGINWTPVDDQGTVNETVRKILYKYGVWIIGGVGISSLATSPDAVNWTERIGDEVTDFRDFAFEGNKTLAAGYVDENNGKIYTTTDGINWTFLTNTSVGLFALAAKN